MLLFPHVFSRAPPNGSFWKCNKICCFSSIIRANSTIISSETVVRRCSVEKVFLEISQNSQENTCARISFLIKLQKRLWHRYFPVYFAKFLRPPLFTEHLWWLLLYLPNKSILWDIQHQNKCPWEPGIDYPCIFIPWSKKVNK